MKKEVKIGIAGIGALLILFFGINYLKGINLFKPESYYYVEFEDINGLAKSSPVFANGFQIGIVNDIQYNYSHPGHVVVCVETNKNMRIPADSHAELITEMLGTVKMNIILNKDTDKFCTEGDTLIGVANNGIMGIAEKELLPKIEVMLPKMDSILTSLNSLLADPALKNTLHNTEQLTASLSSTSRQLNKLMSNEIPQMVKNMNDVSDNLKTISGNLKNVDYASTFEKVDATLTNVRLLSEKLTRKDNTLGLLLNDSALYNNLNATSINAAKLLEDLKEHPKRYVHFSVFGKKDK
ncbi:MlaD family protein [uncultured Bacteroides sp.]|uniref:MlaD family protein n=1 Tax=uncultured Bacteroides sp. TaxID=162156 RepID=UPI00262154C8|nr:MlaD family protein [uncultured Bacteroides sp.]